MRKSRFAETEIVKILKQEEGGWTVKEVCRELGLAEAT
jgi:putative transposase